MPDIYIKLTQMKEILERVKSYFLGTLDESLETSITAAIQEYDSKWSIYEMQLPLYDSSGNQILDDTDGEIQAKLLLVTL
jgi:hypothetical protein